MPCYVPLRAFRTTAGAIVFKERGEDVHSQLWLPCGRCIGCKLERSRQWALRCVHEASLHEHNCFVTLTYADENLPPRSSLEYKHFQDFMKRLRWRFPLRDGWDVSYFAAGEYGELNWRPHWHACLFGVDFYDREVFKSSKGNTLFTSRTLEELWPFGLSSVGELTFETAAYTARYCTKKITGQMAETHYRRVDPETGEIYYLTPEMCRMSLKKPIAKGWFEKWHKDVYPHDYVVVRGKEMKPPKYYDKLLERDFPDVLDDVKFRREVEALESAYDNTFTRLMVKQQCANARLSLKTRSL